MKKLILILLFLYTPFAATAGIVGLVSYIDGKVFRQGNQKLEPGSVLTINDSDSIQSQKNSNLIISFRDGSQLILFENSAVKLNFNRNSYNLIQLVQGDIWLWIKKTGPLYRIQLSDLIVESREAALRLFVSPTKKSGYVTVSSHSATIQDSKSNQKYSSGSQVLFQNSSITQISNNISQIQLSSNLAKYYLPKSGRIPVIIRATLDSGTITQDPVSAFLISSSPNLIVKSPVTSFHQEDIEIEVTAQGAGDSHLYVVSESIGGNPGLDGVLPISVSPMQNTKIMKIKTSRGNINIKLAPTSQ